MGLKANDDWLIRREAKMARRAANIDANQARLAEGEVGRKESRAHKATIRKAAGIARAEEREAKALPVDPRLMTDAELIALAQKIMKVDKYDWKTNARPSQIQPKNYRTWFILSGRGWGKTRASNEAIREWCEKPEQRIAVVAHGHQSLRDTNFEGVSGLLKVFPPEIIAASVYKKGLGDVSLTLPNGSIIFGFTAEAPDALRGRSFDAVVADEFATWTRSKAKDCLDQLWFCLRDTPDPRMIITTTPKRVPHVIEIVKRALDGEEGLVVTRGTTYDNTKLSKAAFEYYQRAYEGTRQGRQELYGELLIDNEMALWTGDMVEGARWEAEADFPPMVNVLVGVDPSGSSDGDATGIVAVGWDKHKVFYVLANRTTKGSPAARYAEVVRVANEFNATSIWYESAYGGDNAAFGIEQAWKNLAETEEITGRCPPVKKSTIKGDKAARAMPVVALYEQNLTNRRRLWHPIPSESNGIVTLEDELLSWDTSSKKSPNSLDALVHAMRQAMRQTGNGGSFSNPAKLKPRGPGGPSRNNVYRPF